MSDEKKRFVVAITGASGSVYGISIINYLSLQGYAVHAILSRSGEKVMKIETSLNRNVLNLPGVTVHDNDDIGAVVASGSFKTDGMVIAPCSMRTLTAGASGSASNLIQRAADVALKEGRKLILVPRETPLNRIHLENMLRALDAGAVIMPAMPAFYGKAKEVAELVVAFAGRVLDQLGVDNDLAPRWEPPVTGEEPPHTGEEPPHTGEEPPHTGEEPPHTGEEPPGEEDD